jgi:hypothetical protein
MNVRLLHRDRSFLPLAEIPRPQRGGGAPGARSDNQDALVRDLELDTLFRAMAADDPFLHAMASRVLLDGVGNPPETIRYRQAILQDALDQPGAIRELYQIATATLENRRRHWWGLRHQSPGSTLSSALELLQMFTEQLEKLRDVADRYAGRVRSEGLAALFTTFRQELSKDYLAEVRRHVKVLRFPRGVLISAELGPYAEGSGHVLRRSVPARRSWLARLRGDPDDAYTFSLHPRDDAGANILAELRDRGVNDVANALGQSADSVLGFFEMLRAEIAFYAGCLNLADRLRTAGAGIGLPDPEPAGSRRLRCAGLYDVCLALTSGRVPVPNDAALDGGNLVIITGANQGGKSTFLRAIGLAQLMMQGGMFVGATGFSAEVCPGIFTHFKREEDPTMTHGKLDEELARMSAIADAIAPNALVLFNESFAGTNEREGSEIARQVATALVARRIKVIFVTHWYDFAHRLYAERRPDAFFLRAERLPDGTRTFRLLPGEPLATGFGADLYREVFGAEVMAG